MRAGTAIGIGISTVFATAKAATVIVGTWILSTNFWVDSSVWKDSSNWQD